MMDKVIGLLMAVVLVTTPGITATEVSQEVETARRYGAYIGPDPDPKSDQYWQQVADSINFRFDTQLTPNCTILYFYLEPVTNCKHISASIGVPTDKFNAVFPASEYEGEEIDRYDWLSPGSIRDFDLTEDDFICFYEWYQSVGEGARKCEVIVCKESEDRVTVHFWANMHTYLNSIEDLEQW